MEKSCSFSGLGNIFCGEVHGHADHDLMELMNCQADISGHLAGCNLSKLEITEAQLILFRAGRFCVSDEQQKSMQICATHRSKLGRKWRPLRSCQYPGHTGPVQKYKKPRVFNPQMSREVQDLYGVLVQIGSCKYSL